MRLLAILCLVLALSQLGAAAWIQLKAELAQVLIGLAWERSLPHGPGRASPGRASPGRASPGREKPWPWSDTWPVARLVFPERGVDLFVLAGDRGNSLAFGPGHLSRSAEPGGAGITLIGGHRDTHFAFLEQVKPGETLLLVDPARQTHRYRVRETRVVDIRRGPLIAGGDGVILVTCFPFDAVRPGGPLRFLVIARPL